MIILKFWDNYKLKIAIAFEILQKLIDVYILPSKLFIYRNLKIINYRLFYYEPLTGIDGLCIESSQTY